MNTALYHLAVVAASNLNNVPKPNAMDMEIAITSRLKTNADSQME